MIAYNISELIQSQTNYHSAPMARDRDRLRQEQLEALGWKFVRIWSLDWFMRRDEEVQRALDAYSKAVQIADEQDKMSGKAGNQRTSGPLLQGPPLRSELGSRADAGNTGNSGEVGGSRPGLPAGQGRNEPNARGPKPQVPMAEKIDDYRTEDVRAIVQWVLSDGKLRTDDEIVEEAARELGFSRMGPKIDATIRNEVQVLKLGRG